MRRAMRGQLRDAMLLGLTRRHCIMTGKRLTSVLTRSMSAMESPVRTSYVTPKRVRQHVNPLSQKYREPITLPNWSETFTRPELPIHLDIGCARGKYLNMVAEQNAETTNFIGVEIRQSVLEEATEEAKLRGLRNIAFIHANMNFQQRLLLTSLPAPIQSVSIFHPDPWMKKRHYKRRLVTDEFVVELAQLLESGTPIFVQTDVEELFEYMVEIFKQSKKYSFEPLETNPFTIPTDRESYVTKQGGDIYRIKVIVLPAEPEQEASPAESSSN